MIAGAWQRDSALKALADRHGGEDNAAELVAITLLAALSERGLDSAGYAASDGQTIYTRKQSGDVADIFPSVTMPPDVQRMMVHVRDYTKGTPGVEANNHPVVHRSWLCVHNGRIQNDDELFAEAGEQRDEPNMTVDSAAISLAAHHWGPEAATDHLIGSYAAALLDRQHPEQMWLLRGNGRPLHMAVLPSGVWFASTQEALLWSLAQLGVAQMDTQTLMLSQRVAEGTGITLEQGRVKRSWRFTPRLYKEEPIEGYNWQDPHAQAVRAQVEAMLESSQLLPLDELAD